MNIEGFSMNKENSGLCDEETTRPWCRTSSLECSSRLGFSRSTSESSINKKTISELTMVPFLVRHIVRKGEDVPDDISNAFSCTKSPLLLLTDVLHWFPYGCICVRTPLSSLKLSEVTDHTEWLGFVSACVCEQCSSNDDGQW